MTHNYRNMMEQVSMSEDARASILEQLENKKPQRRTRPLWVLPAAVCVCLALVGTAFAAVSLTHQRTLANGTTILMEEDEDGALHRTMTVMPEEDCVILRDGRFYLTVNGETLDITGQFSETDYYLYRSENEDGSYEDIIVGGTEEAYGYVIYIYDAGGASLGAAGGGTYEDNMAPTAWREAYRADTFS